MSRELFTVTVEHRNGVRYTYRGVLILRRQGALDLLTLNYLDPADTDALASADAEHVISFPYSAMWWWLERPYEGPPYILVTDDMQAEADRLPLNPTEGHDDATP